MKHKKLRLIGYIRTGGSTLSIEEQKRNIEAYCCEHGHKLVHISIVDTDIPSSGLEESLDMLQGNDGIIAVDLNRFVKHHEDRLFDLRPLIQKMLHENKILIAVNEQFETQTALGQQTALDMIHEWSDRESVIMPPVHEHSDYHSF